METIINANQSLMMITSMQEDLESIMLPGVALTVALCFAWLMAAKRLRRGADQRWLDALPVDPRSRLAEVARGSPSDRLFIAGLMGASLVVAAVVLWFVVWFSL